jgi:hypothetical protein
MGSLKVMLEWIGRIDNYYKETALILFHLANNWDTTLFLVQ